MLAQLFCLREEQAEPFRPFFLKEQGVKRVDAPTAYRPHKNLYNRCRRLVRQGCLGSDLFPSCQHPAPQSHPMPQEPEVVMIAPPLSKPIPRRSGSTGGGLPLDRQDQPRGRTSHSMGSAPAKVVPCRLHLSERQWSDATDVDGGLKDLPPAAAVIGNKGYDSDKNRKMLAQQRISPCIPPRRSPRKAVHHSKGLYRMRHNIENLFIPTEWLAAHCKTLMIAVFPFSSFPVCHPPGHHCPLPVMSLDPEEQ